MKRNYTLFTLLGFRVRIHTSWLIVAVLLTWSLAQGYFPFKFKDLSTATYWVMGVVGALGLFFSILLHEFGHSLVARRYGLPIKGITLFIFGGVAEMQDEPRTAESELRMAIAGPAVSIALAVFFYLVNVSGRFLGWPVSVTGVFHYLAWINGLLVAFNLVPAFPLDGGRVLRSMLWKRWGNLRNATRTASRIGSGFGVALVALGIINILMGNFIGGLWWFLIGMFLQGASRTSYQQLEIRQILEGEPISRFMKVDPVTVPPSISVEDLVQEYIYRHHFHQFPVVEGGRLLGCVGTQQVKTIPRTDWAQHIVRDVLTKCSPENTVSADTDSVQVLSKMTRTGNSRFMVVDVGGLVGVVSLRDLLTFLSLRLDLEGAETSGVTEQIRKLPLK